METCPFTRKRSGETRPCCSTGLLRPLRQLCFLLRLDFHRVRELPAISTVELLGPVDVSCQLQSPKGASTYWPEATGYIKVLNLVSRGRPQLENTAQIKGKAGKQERVKHSPVPSLCSLKSADLGGCLHCLPADVGRGVSLYMSCQKYNWPAGLICIFGM